LDVLPFGAAEQRESDGQLSDDYSKQVLVYQKSLFLREEDR
jgi:hypothetical protein